MSREISRVDVKQLSENFVHQFLQTNWHIQRIHFKTFVPYKTSPSQIVKKYQSQINIFISSWKHVFGFQMNLLTVPFNIALDKSFLFFTKKCHYFYYLSIKI